MRIETLTSVHYFDLHRNVRMLKYGISLEVSIGAYSHCDIRLPQPTLYGGVIAITKDHLLKVYDSGDTTHTPATERHLFPPLDQHTIELQGVVLTVRRSWNPFVALIDTLIEEVGIQATSETITPAVLMQWLPPEVVRVWPLEVIWETFESHRKGYGDIECLMHHKNVTEVLINGSESVYCEEGGMLRRLPYALSPLRLDRLITKLVQNSGRSVNTKRPMVDLQLTTGERVNIILPPVSKKGPLISIRKFRRELNSLEALETSGTFSHAMHQKLTSWVSERKNILISGGTGSGKTTLLNALLSACDSKERIIIVEDASELAPHHPHAVSLETRPPNQDPDVEISMAALIKNTLRMRPTRVICGECRGPEAFQMLLAMNSGHPGSMTTIHANSPLEALYRLEIFLLMANFDVPHRALRQFIVSAIDVVIQMQWADQRRILTTAVCLAKHIENEQYVLTPISTPP